MSEVEWRLCSPQGNKGATRPDVRIALLAARQNGVVATRQLKDRGLDAKSIMVRVRRGQLHPIFRGVYAVGHDSLSQAATFTAAVLAGGDGAVLSDHAAAAHLGMRAWDGRAPEVTVPRAGGRRIDGIKVHRRQLDDRDIWTRDNIRVTCPARTILDIATTLPAKALRRTVRQAQAEQHVNVRQLLELLARHRGHRGAGTLRAAIADGPVPTRSALEDVVLDLIDEAGIERPEINPRLQVDGRTIVPDMLWREQGLVVELDGLRWHSDPLSRENDAERQAILEAHRQPQRAPRAVDRLVAARICSRQRQITLARSRSRGSPATPRALGARPRHWASTSDRRSPASVARTARPPARRLRSWAPAARAVAPPRRCG